MNLMDNYPPGFREPSRHYDSNEKLYYIDNGSFSGEVQYYLDYECAILHRIEGPAIEGGELDQWFYNGIYVDVKSQKEFEQWIKYKNFL